MGLVIGLRTTGASVYLVCVGVFLHWTVCRRNPYDLAGLLADSLYGFRMVV